MSGTPCLAHYGVTVAEPPVPDGELPTAPPGGDAAAGLAFLGHLGFEPMHTNLYPASAGSGSCAEGRSATRATSSAICSPRSAPTPRPPAAMYRMPAMRSSDFQSTTRCRCSPTCAHRAGRRPTSGREALFRGPDAALYELAPLSGDETQDRTVSLWTDPASLDDAVATWCRLFGFTDVGASSFHGVAVARVLRRVGDGAITLNLLTPRDGGGRWHRG